MNTRHPVRWLGNFCKEVCKELKNKKLRRYILLSLAGNALGYTLVFLLVRYGDRGSMTANTVVSKSLAPLGLVFNTYALASRFRPTRAEFAKWFVNWLPTTLMGTAVLAVVIAHSGLDSIEARAFAAMLLFPFDYVVKRYFVFARQTRLVEFLLRHISAIASEAILTDGVINACRTLRTETA